MNRIPNILSFARILLAIALVLPPAFSKPFCFMYILAGITDMLDGAIARKLNACTDFGAKLDSTGDLVFVSVCLPKVLFAVNVPGWLWLCIAAIAFIRIFNMVYGKIKYRKFVMLHTVPNKISGFLLFLLPLVLVFVNIKYASIPVCAFTLFSSLHESFTLKKQAFTAE